MGVVVGHNTTADYVIQLAGPNNYVG